MACLEIDIGALEVTELNDGGMGSLAIGDSYETRRFGKEIAKCQFNDSDGIVVSVTLNIDESEALYELDVWKTDFQPLVRWPTPEELRSDA